MIQLARHFGGRTRAFTIWVSLGLVALVGAVDYYSGFELTFYAFYLIPVALASWFIGPGFGILISMLCVGTSVAGDVVAGLRYSSAFVLIWNSLIAVVSYSGLVWILAKLRSAYDDMEQRVRQRTAALRNEMQERMHLEEEILRIRELEQQRIGHDLHDSLCQHLTATALAAQVLTEQLAQSPPQERASRRVVELLEEAIEVTRKLARGLHPLGLKGEGLTDALSELTSTIQERYKIPCRFESQGPIQSLTLRDEDAIHLYRIAQEAVTNAGKHSKASQIIARIETAPQGITLTVTDNGAGVQIISANHQGMGLKIMAHRATLIGADFKVERLSPHGTLVTCVVPVSRTRS